jgi:glycopeptide antibiotics resistance protein
MLFRHPILSIATVAYLVLVGWITLSPQSGIGQNSIVWRLVEFFEQFPGADWLTFSRVEFLANIALFVPLGLFFVLLFGRRQWWLAIVFSVVTTLGIEFSQQYIGGRVPDVRDIVANSIGGAIGAVLALILTYADARRFRRAQRDVHLPGSEKAPSTVA